MENLPTYRLTQSGPEAQEILDQVNLNTIDIEQLKRLYQALTQSEPEIIDPTDTWPVANPEENVIYRVIDRVNTPPQYYTDYMWNGTLMVPMAQYNNAIDNEPTANSSNLVKSGGVYSFVHANGGAYDISAAHAVGGVLATYDDLADALGTNGANVPAAVRKGGMSIKFVLSSDNKYVQFRYMGTAVTGTPNPFLNTANWQGVDVNPKPNSKNLVESGGAFEEKYKFLYENRGTILPNNNLFYRKNLFNPSSPNIIDNSYFSSGNTISSNSNYYISDYIVFTEDMGSLKISQNGSLISSAAYACFYDKDKNYVSSQPLDNNPIINWQENVAYIRVSINKEWTKIQIERGSQITSYVPYEQIELLPIVIDDENIIKIGSDKCTFFEHSANLLNIGAAINGYYVTYTDGVLRQNANYLASDYIEVEPSTDYYINTYGGNKLQFAWYNKYKVYISGQNSYGVITSPSNAKFLRVSIGAGVRNSSIVAKSSVAVEYVPYQNILKTECIPAISLLSPTTIIDKYNDSLFVISINLVNPADIVTGKYVSKTNGTLFNNSSYNATGYIEVESGLDYYISGYGQYAWYDANKTYISGGVANGNEIITAVTNAKYIRCSIQVAYASIYIVAQSSVAVEYVPYGIYIKDEYVRGINELSDKVKSIRGAEGISISDEALNNLTTVEITSFPYYIKKGTSISFYAEVSSFSELYIGKGFEQYRGSWLKITPTEVIKQSYESSTSSSTIGEHGLTFDTFIKVVMSLNNAGQMKIIIQTLGGYFTTTVENWGYESNYAPFVRKSGGTISNYTLSVVNADLKNAVWTFGDSYFGITSERWPGVMKSFGFFNFLIDGLAGLGSTAAYTELVKMLNFAQPKYLIWALGMNDAYNDWKNNFDKVKNICDTYKITLIASTIPTVPTRSKEDISSYVRNSGVRYIDFYKAVGTNSQGNWYSGYLSQDGVHPSALGAQALATQVLADFPEIMEY